MAWYYYGVYGKVLLWCLQYCYDVYGIVVVFTQLLWFLRYGIIMMFMVRYYYHVYGKVLLWTNYYIIIYGITDGVKDTQKDVAADEDQSWDGQPVSHDGSSLIDFFLFYKFTFFKYYITVL